MSNSLCTEYSVLFHLRSAPGCKAVGFQTQVPVRASSAAPVNTVKEWEVYSFLHLKAHFAELRRGWVKLVPKEDTDYIEQVLSHISNAHNSTVLDCIQVAVPWRCAQCTACTGECRKRGGGHVRHRWRWIFPFSSYWEVFDRGKGKQAIVSSQIRFKPRKQSLGWMNSRSLSICL